MQDEEEDPFWSVALLQDPQQQQQHELVAAVEEEEKEVSLPPQQQLRVEVGEEKVVKYRLPYVLSSSFASSSCCSTASSPNHDDVDDFAAAAAAAAATTTTTTTTTADSNDVDTVTLELASLPMTEDGIMGPVGGDAWYASAILTTMILQDFNNKKEFDDDDDDEKEEEEGQDATLLQPQLQLQQLVAKDRRRKFAACVGDGDGGDGTDIGTGRSSSRSRSKREERFFKVLELGSGAVALPGLSCAVALETIRQWRQKKQQQKIQKQHNQIQQTQKQHRKGDDDTYHSTDGNEKAAARRRNDGNKPNYDDDDESEDGVYSWQIYLTDNDPDVLEQLKRNVQRNMSKILPPFVPPHDGDEVKQQQQLQQQPEQEKEWNLKKETPVKVSHLDWDVPNNGDGGDDNSKILDGVDLVIGSELVYTESTGHALLKVLKQLLRKNRDVVIWIVQVFDRYGWTEIVVPGLESDPSVHIELYDTIPINTHQVASTLIPMGGTLDRYAFGAVCIKNAVLE